MESERTWRDLLGNVIKNPQERARLAGELGVNILTLTRWVKGDTVPRPYHLRQLLNALPEQRDELLSLLPVEYPEINLIAKEDVTEDQGQKIPPDFYARIIEGYLNLPELLGTRNLRHLILEQALKQLDPHALGMMVIVAQCLAPLKGNKVRSLRVNMGRGNSPWEGDLEQSSFLLGAESLAGYAVASARSFLVQNTDEGSFLPTIQTDWEKSQCVCPIMRLNMIAGCFLVSSTQPDYFRHFHQKLIQEYANLLALTFQSEEFYKVEDIELGMMPPRDSQKGILASFRSRVSNILLEATRNHKSLSIIEAEQMAWQELEEELLNLA